MKIDSIIDRNYYSVSVLEDMSEIRKWLQERDYYAIIDENDLIVGVVTATDYLANPLNQLINCCTSKPHLSPDTSVAEAYQLMKKDKHLALPVFKDGDFIGIVSIWSITNCAFELLNKKETKQRQVLGESA